MNNDSIVVGLLAVLLLVAGTSAKAGEWQLYPPGPGCWKPARHTIAESKWLPCNRGEWACLCRGRDSFEVPSSPNEEAPIPDVTTTALKAACNKIVNDVTGTLWLLGRAAAATADPSFSSAVREAVDEGTRELSERLRLTYRPEERNIGDAFETGYDAIDLGLGAYGVGKTAVTAGRKAIEYFGRKAAEAAAKGLPEAATMLGSHADEAVEAIASRADEAAETAATKAVDDDLSEWWEENFSEKFSGNDLPSGHRTNARHARGLRGEMHSTEALAADGHDIIHYKPDISETTRPGFDAVTMKDGYVYFVDNKAYTRGGRIYDVSALTTNFGKNLKATVRTLQEMLTQPMRSEAEREVFGEALEAIRNGNYHKLVTNANLTKGRFPTSCHRS